MKSISIYNAAAYARASKEDADSSTIENQIQLIRGHVQSMSEIRIVSAREDNGFSGIDFLRPSFTEMMKDIESGKINCVIVKDLSRLGRNYIEVGELMDVIFPRMGVRLIAIGDNYDSLNPRSDSDDIIIPFRNLINEQYLRDNSNKTRKSLEAKRKSGAFVSPIAPYGYIRDEADKHRLVVDEHAAKVVRDIFRWKLEGMSAQRIADRLNGNGEPSPAEYKRRDSSFFTAFQTHTRASWSAVAIGRILRNPMYVGTLVQGKRTTPNYKVKKEIVKPEDEWNITPNAHEAIIDKGDFEIVNRLLEQYSRAAPARSAVFPLSGMIFCGNCGNNMIRKKTEAQPYYICATRKAGKDCTAHYFRQTDLENAVMEAVKIQIACVLQVEQTLDYVHRLPYLQREVVKLYTQTADRETEIKGCEDYKRALYEDFKNGIISEEDFLDFGKSYTARIAELKKGADRLRREAELLASGNSQSHQWTLHFKRFRNVTVLSRELAVSLIERIEVYNDKRIYVQFRYQDRIGTALEILDGFEEVGGAVCHG